MGLALRAEAGGAEGSIRRLTSRPIDRKDGSPLRRCDRRGIARHLGQLGEDGLRILGEGMKKKEKRGGAGRGQGRKPQDPAKKKHSRSVCLTESAWERLRPVAAARQSIRSEVIQRWAERLPIL